MLRNRVYRYEKHGHRTLAEAPNGGRVVLSVLSVRRPEGTVVKGGDGLGSWKAARFSRQRRASDPERSEVGSNLSLEEGVEESRRVCDGE